MISDSEDRIRQCNQENLTQGSDELVKMILLDAVFVVELFIRNHYLWGSESTTLLCLFDGPEGGTVDPLGKKLKTQPWCRKLVTPSWRRGWSKFMAIRDNAGDAIPSRVAEQELARSRIRTATPKSLDRKVPDLDEEDEDGEDDEAVEAVRAQRSCTRLVSSSDGLREPRPYSMSSSGTGSS
ncbi:hypothetical protein NL676_038593 [Syzygium grande]|nr:hypothetical protein NL676_038593 [Syzygium grande]